MTALTNPILTLVIFGLLGPPVGMLVFLIPNGGGYLLAEVRIAGSLLAASYEVGFLPAIIAAVVFSALSLAYERLARPRRVGLLLAGFFGAIAGVVVMSARTVLQTAPLWPPGSEVMHVLIVGLFSGLACGVLVVQLAARRHIAGSQNAG